MPFHQNTSFRLDFSGFVGAGFSPTPAAGQLNSNEFRLVGFSDPGGANYGATLTTPNTDYARGTISGIANPTVAGVYAALTADSALGTSFVIQPTAAEFGTTPGTITLRVQYTGLAIVTGFKISYDGVYRNNADRSSAVAVSYAVESAATEPTIFSAPVSLLGFTTPSGDVGGDAAPWMQVARPTVSINSTIDPNSYVFIRFTIGDNAAGPGTGNRDEVGFDNIVISAIDTTPPVPPSRPMLVADSDSGILSDGVTSATTLTLTGTAEAGSTITITEIDVPIVLGTAPVSGTGRWSFTAAALAQGIHAFLATATDAAGNTSAASAALLLTIDTTSPVAPSSPMLAAASDSGTLGDGVTSDNTPTLIGAAEAGSTVTVIDSNSGIPVVLGMASVSGSGGWSFTPNTALAQGIHSFTVTATDAASNISTASTALLVTIDTTPPTAPLPAGNQNGNGSRALYRFFDTLHGTHYFTADATEAASVTTTRSDLVEEVNNFGSVTQVDPNAEAVYRFFDTVHGTQFFTAAATEAQTIRQTRPDLTYEPDSTFYEHATQQVGDVAVYRFFDVAVGTHFYTGSQTEFVSVATHGSATYRADFTFEGFAFYAPAGVYST